MASGEDTLTTRSLRHASRDDRPSPRRSPRPPTYVKPVWWRPYLDETDKQILAFAGTFALGGMGALLAFALRWAWLQQ